MQLLVHVILMLADMDCLKSNKQVSLSLFIG